MSGRWCPNAEADAACALHQPSEQREPVDPAQRRPRHLKVQRGKWKRTRRCCAEIVRDLDASIEGVVELHFVPNYWLRVFLFRQLARVGRETKL
jgi:hypothetical protein